MYYFSSWTFISQPLFWPMPNIFSFFFPIRLLVCFCTPIIKNQKAEIATVLSQLHPEKQIKFVHRGERNGIVRIAPLVSFTAINTPPLASPPKKELDAVSKVMPHGQNCKQKWNWKWSALVCCLENGFLDETHRSTSEQRHRWMSEGYDKPAAWVYS